MHARGFNGLQVPHIGASISRAARDHDRAGADPFGVRKGQHKAAGPLAVASSPLTWSGIAISTPNFWAWL